MKKYNSNFPADFYCREFFESMGSVSTMKKFRLPLQVQNILLHLRLNKQFENMLGSRIVVL